MSVRRKLFSPSRRQPRYVCRPLAGPAAFFCGQGRPTATARRRTVRKQLAKSCLAEDENKALPKSPDTRTIATRNNLIESGLALLQEEGGYGLTSRKIAQHAGVNHTLINYHFNSLSSLLDAIFEHCIQKLHQNIMPFLDAYITELDQTPDDRLANFIQGQVPALLRVFSAKDNKPLLNLLSSPQARYLGTYAMLQEAVLLPLHRAMSKLAARATRQPPESLEVGVLGHLALTQVMAFFRGGYPVCRHMNWRGIPDDAQATIDGMVADSICRIFHLSV